MANAARALIIRPTRTDGDVALQPKKDTLYKLQIFGIAIMFAEAGPEGTIDAVDALPDIVILDARSEEDIASFADIATKLRENAFSALLPIAVVCDPEHFDMFSVDGYLDARMPANVMARKLKQITRLSAMSAEYDRRLETAASLNVKISSLPKQPSQRNVRLLYIGRGERYFQLAQAFSGDAVMRSVSSFIDAVTELTKGHYDCLVIDTVSYPAFSLDEVETLKQNVRYFNLPVLVLQEGLDVAEQQMVLEQGLCDLFVLGADAQDIVTFAQTAIQSGALRHQLQEALSLSHFQPFSDGKTGLPSGKFFEKHLERLTEQSRAWRLPMAFAVFQIDPLTDDGLPLDKARHDMLVDQVGNAIASLVRVEDVGTHLGDGKFIVVAPNSSGFSISVLSNRINSILRSTEFQVNGIATRVSVAADYFVSEADHTSKDVMLRLMNA